MQRTLVYIARIAKIVKTFQNKCVKSNEMTWMRLTAVVRQPHTDAQYKNQWSPPEAQEADNPRRVFSVTEYSVGAVLLILCLVPQLKITNFTAFHPVWIFYRRPPILWKMSWPRNCGLGWSNRPYIHQHSECMLNILGWDITIVRSWWL